MQSLLLQILTLFILHIILSLVETRRLVRPGKEFSYQARRKCSNSTACMFCDCYEGKCRTNERDRKIAQCYKDLFFSPEKIAKLPTFIESDAVAELRDYVVHWRKDCLKCKERPTYGEKCRYRPLYKNSQNNPFVAAAQATRSSGEQEESCCNTTWAAISPITVEFKGSMYTVTNYNGALYQIFYIGQCAVPYSKCVDNGECLNETEYPTFVLINDPNSANGLGMRYIYMRYPRYCRCTNVGS